MKEILINSINIINVILFILSYISLYFTLSILADKYNLVDKNDFRKIHKGRVPLIGGVLIYLCFAINIVIFDLNINYNFSVIFLSIFLIIVVGILDDIYNIPPYIRLFFQIIAISVIINSGLSITNFQFNNYNISLGIFGFFFTIVSLVAITNAFNFIDGIDGLCSSLFLMPLLTVIVILYNNNIYSELLIFLLLFIIVFIFFILNFGILKLGKIFLGDSGSTFLGFILGCILIYLAELNIIETFFVPWLIIIPIFDLLRVVIFRLINNINPTYPDRIHIHHILTRYFNSSIFALICINIISIVMIIFGYFISNIDSILSIVFYLCFFAIFFFTTNLLDQNLKKNDQ